MKQSTVPLNDMALFVEVGSVLNFRKAAQATGIPSSTLSRRMNHLESILGLRLLNRTTRSIEFTEAGQLYYDRLKPIIEKANNAHEELSSLFTHPNGVLKASLPVDFTNKFIAPLLPEFCKMYPDITFDFDLTAEDIDMVDDYYDVAIRLGEQRDSNLIIQLLGKMPLQLYASPEYIEKFGEPKTPKELKSHECITKIYKEWELCQNGVKTVFNPQSKFKLNNLGVLSKLVTLGMGITLIPQEFIKKELEQGKIVRIMSDCSGTDVPVYAITKSRLMSKKTKIFIEFLKNRLQQGSID